MPGETQQRGSVTLDHIESARAAIAGQVCRTPLVPAFSLSSDRRQVFLKLEILQATGAFKLRGATYALQSLSPAEKARGVVAISTGNHGRGVAYAARLLGLRAVVCMSRLVPQNKRAAIADLGAEVRIFGESQDEAEEEAARAVAEEGLVPISPFDHPQVIAGQGTIGLELREDLPDLDSVLVPVSGGGLIAGIAQAVKSASPRPVRVIGVTMERGAAMHASQAAGQPVLVPEEESLADALGGGIGLENRHTFAMVRDLVDDLILVSEEEIAAAMAHLYWQERTVVEGSGAVGVAALLSGKARDLGSKTAVVVSGRNVDMTAFTELVAARA